MKTKLQKGKEIKQGEELLGKSGSLVFTDFTGTTFEALKKLKTELKKTSSTFKVIKKRLLKIALNKKGIDFDPTTFESQVGAVYAPGDISSVASTVHKFAKDLAKEKKEFKILGAYDITGKLALSAEEFTVIAKLPTREVLLGQLVGVLTAPVRQFMVVLQEIGKKKTVEVK